jgi:uncharacterized membrane protein
VSSFWLGLIASVIGSGIGTLPGFWWAFRIGKKHERDTPDGV